jgi:hypothetical protein
MKVYDTLTERWSLSGKKNQSYVCSKVKCSKLDEWTFSI